MLSLSFRRRDMAFVFHGGHAIGAFVVGDMGISQVPILFAGEKRDFEVLRSNVVERIHGRQELLRLIARFFPD